VLVASTAEQIAKGSLYLFPLYDRLNKLKTASAFVGLTFPLKLYK